MRLFRLTGHARRRELLAVALLFVVLMLAAWWLNTSPYWHSARYAIAAALICYAALVATQVRRLHDINRSGTWAALSLVPLCGLALTLALVIWPPAGRKRIGVSRAAVLGQAAVVLLVLLGLGRLVWHPALVTSETMKPNLLVGDLVLARPTSLAGLSRGDVVLFRHPLQNAVFIARLIGLPGDRVQMRSGLVWLNGELLPQTYAGTFEERMAPQGPLRLRPRCKGGPVGDGGLCHKARLTETIPAQGDMPARKFDVLNIENGAYADDTPVFTVPEGQLFVMGDNRDNSIDSRFGHAGGGMGMIPADRLIGRLSIVLLSTEGDALWKFWTWRGDRVVKGVE